MLDEREKWLTKEMKGNGQKELHARADHHQVTRVRATLQSRFNDFERTAVCLFRMMNRLSRSFKIMG